MASPLAGWENFYVIVGSSGAALTGLQFVVIALVAELPRRGSLESIDAFGTPTIVHFGTVLLVSAIISAPWTGLWTVSALFAILGAVGVGYVAVVLRRARAQSDYTPVFEDWLWHNILPFVAYFGLALGGIFLSTHTTGALFTVGAMSILLLFIGIHNAWDTVTFLATDRIPRARAEAGDDKRSSGR